MKLQENRFKSAIARGERQLGIWSTLCSAMGAEAIAHAGFDWVLFDAEHSPVEISALLPLLQAAATGTATPIIRPPWNDSVLLKRVLDVGARTVLVPFVQSAAEAAAAVRSCHYPPSGIRGVAGTTRASGYGRIKGYLQNANEQICVLVQVETGEAISHLAEIAAVPGVDGVFIGPSDLSASLGHIGNPGHPDVQAVIRDAVGTIRNAGKAPGILATTPVDAKRYAEWGYVFVACGVDLAMLVKASDHLIDEMNQR